MKIFFFTNDITGWKFKLIYAIQFAYFAISDTLRVKMGNFFNGIWWNLMKEVILSYQCQTKLETGQDFPFLAFVMIAPDQPNRAEFK